MRIAQQEEELLNLMRAEEEEEASERLALQRKQRAQQTMQAMAEANALQIQYKVSQTSRSAKIRPDVAAHVDGGIDQSLLTRSLSKKCRVCNYTKPAALQCISHPQRRQVLFLILASSTCTTSRHSDAQLPLVLSDKIHCLLSWPCAACNLVFGKSWGVVQAQRLAAENKEEKRFREVLLAKFAEEDKLDQMNQHKRRLKLEEHKREAAKLAAQKKSLEKLVKVIPSKLRRQRNCSVRQVCTLLNSGKPFMRTALMMV